MAAILASAQQEEEVEAQVEVAFTRGARSATREPRGTLCESGLAGRTPEAKRFIAEMGTLQHFEQVKAGQIVPAGEM